MSRSESMELGSVIRLLDKAKRTWGSGDSHALIEEAQRKLRELQEQAIRGYHRNPPMRRGRRIAERNYSARKVGLMSTEVHAVLYRHIEDGKQYRHDFAHETSLIALLHGEANDVLITSPDGFPIWQEF